MSDRETLSTRLPAVVNRFFRDVAVIEALSHVTKDGFADRVRNFEEIAEKFGSGLPVEIHIFEGEAVTPERVARFKPDELRPLVPIARVLADAFSRIPAVVLEMQLLYAFALYEGAKSDVLRALFGSWPELIGSERTISAREAVQIVETGDLLDVLAAREAQWYTDKAVAEQFRSLEKRLDLVPDMNSDIQAKMSALHALRNVLIHNSGVVDERYHRVVGGSGPPIGSRVEVTKQVINDALVTLKGFVVWLGRSVAVRYGTGDPLAEAGSGWSVLGYAEDGESPAGLAL